MLIRSFDGRQHYFEFDRQPVDLSEQHYPIGLDCTEKKTGADVLSPKIRELSEFTGSSYGHLQLICAKCS
jgi:hypothetical protein